MLMSTLRFSAFIFRDTDIKRRGRGIYPTSLWGRGKYYPSLCMLSLAQIHHLSTLIVVYPIRHQFDVSIKFSRKCVNHFIRKWHISDVIFAILGKKQMIFQCYLTVCTYLQFNVKGNKKENVKRYEIERLPIAYLDYFTSILTSNIQNLYKVRL